MGPPIGEFSPCEINARAWSHPGIFENITENSTNSKFRFTEYWPNQKPFNESGLTREFGPLILDRARLRFDEGKLDFFEQNQTGAVRQPTWSPWPPDATGPLHMGFAGDFSAETTDSRVRVLFTIFAHQLTTANSSSIERWATEFVASRTTWGGTFAPGSDASPPRTSSFRVWPIESDNISAVVKEARESATPPTIVDGLGGLDVNMGNLSIFLLSPYRVVTSATAEWEFQLNIDPSGSGMTYVSGRRDLDAADVRDITHRAFAELGLPSPDPWAIPPLAPGECQS